jgi:hypothetical protein
MEQQQCDVIKLRGCISVALYANGKEVERVTNNNVVVTAGRRWILQQIASSEIDTALSIGYMAVGTGTAAAATNNTGLGSETTRKAINNFTTSNLTSNPPSWQAEMSLATNEGNTTLGEIGMFNSSADGTLLNRAVFGTINKTTSNTLGISYTLSG